MKKTIQKSKEFIELCEKYGVDPDNVPELMSFEACCTHMNYDPEKIIPDVSVFPARHQKALTGTAKLFIIHEAFNYDDKKKEVYEPDWNSNDRKWSYWFDMEKDDNNPSGFRFYDSLFDFTLTRSGVGSRLCFKTSELAKYAGTQFKKLYEQYFLLK